MVSLWVRMQTNSAERYWNDTLRVMPSIRDTQTIIYIPLIAWGLCLVGSFLLPANSLSSLSSSIPHVLMRSSGFQFFW